MHGKLRRAAQDVRSRAVHDCQDTRAVISPPSLKCVFVDISKVTCRKHVFEFDFHNRRIAESTALMIEVDLHAV